MVMAGSRSKFIPGALGIAVFVAAWEVVGRSGLLGLTFPPLSAVLATLFDPANMGLYLRATSTTISAAGAGYFIGGGLGLMAAVIGRLAPGLHNGLSRFAAVVNSVPPIALAPIFLVLFSTSSTPAAIAAIKVYFIVFVSAHAGLSNISPAKQDLFSSLGSGRLARFWYLECPSALPVFVSGLRLAVPVALIGAFVGEWFGATRGLGVLILNAMQNFQIPLLWSTVLLATAVSLFFYFCLTALERRLSERFGS